MVAPVDGTIGKIFETNHAFSIESDSGIELFVHFGIDTVELKAKASNASPKKVSASRKVTWLSSSTCLCWKKSQVYPDAGRYLQHGRIKELIKLSGSVTVGETPIIRIKK